MANLSYAPPGSGPYANAIGWLNFPDSLAPNATTTANGTLRDGSTISLQITNNNTTPGHLVSFVGVTVPIDAQSPFGNPIPGGYAGVSGDVAFLSEPTGVFNVFLIFSNIVVKNPFGVTIPNYTIILCDAGTTGPNEGFIYRTDGSVWQNLGIIGSGTSPDANLFGTTNVVFLGSGSTFRSFVSSTDSPQNISIETGGFAAPTQIAIAFGVALTNISVSKFITDKAYSNDQFNFSVTSSTVTTTTTTTGNIQGVQPQTIPMYIASDYIINETMAPGSSSNLNTNYMSIVQNSNLTPGGTTVPSISSLGSTVTVAVGDFILSTIVNTPITSTLRSTKTVDKSNTFPGDTLTYTVSLNNMGPLSIGNVVFIDTIPAQGNLVTNSITLNGITVPGTVAPPSGLNIGTIPLGISTITFKVALQNTLPVGTLIQNISTSFGNNALVFSTVPISSNSNTLTNAILGTASISTSKIVSKNFANLGDLLTYTIPITNNGNTTAFNIVFIDTIPNGTTFVTNSLKQDGTIVSGSSNPPGVTLPNSIGPGVTSTVSFQVTVNTISNLSPILNSASQEYTYIFDATTNPNTTTIGSASTNIAVTTINNANLVNIVKGSDKAYATCGDIITYTITIPNSGNSTATNVVFRDIIPNGTNLILNSLTVNGIIQQGLNPSLGLTIPDIGPGGVNTVSFKVKVNC